MTSDSHSEANRRVSAVEIAPHFHLTYAFDRPKRPTEVTIYPAGGVENRTRWISADVSDTISVDRIR
jgi:hypothetical protein